MPDASKFHDEFVALPEEFVMFVGERLNGFAVCASATAPLFDTTTLFANKLSASALSVDVAVNTGNPAVPTEPLLE